jgi:hypothetical protein
MCPSRIYVILAIDNKFRTDAKHIFPRKLSGFFKSEYHFGNTKGRKNLIGNFTKIGG